ncbi:hypothetical protein H6P81_010649 [Aristolochia fimbriata]|uniref:Integrase zinc-binding domain-containing protein n=1 Tax=Aristolochia fimbriata TaxID=158543 RepID=A0AAV7EQI5_ARIFI|nr:hypothetical protein H6P81_010649 [Aristolochia fimbriata]
MIYFQSLGALNGQKEKSKTKKETAAIKGKFKSNIEEAISGDPDFQLDPNLDHRFLRGLRIMTRKIRPIQVGFVEFYIFKVVDPVLELAAEAVQLLKEHDEQLYEAWERFKELLRKCPNHGIPLWMQIETFYNGITVSTRNLIDAAAGGTMNKKTPNEVYELIEEMSSNIYQYPVERSARGRVAGIQNVDPIVALQAQVESLTNQLSKLHKPSLVAQICDMCGGGHPSQECQAGNVQAVNSFDQANYVSNFRRSNDPYNNTYNPGWRNHPNFSWSNNNNQQSSTQQPMAQTRSPPGFQRPAQEPEQKPSLEDMFSKFLANQDKRDALTNSKFQAQEASLKIQEASLKNQEASIKNLEIQMGQLANAISGKNQGTLPSNSETNPREQIKAITLRSGKVLEEQQHTQVEEDSTNQQQDKEREELSQEREVSKQKKQKGKASKNLSNDDINVDTLSYPTRAKKDKLEDKFSKFIDIFKKLEINIPFVEALMQMPQYAKFLKEVLSGKRKIEEQGTVMLKESCSAILKNQLPTKHKDPGSFTIPCEFGNFKFNKVLCDLGASINLMPLSICRKLNLGELKETNIMLQFADRSTKKPNGLIEDVLVRIGKFIYPCDFVVLDMEHEVMMKDNLKRCLVQSCTKEDDDPLMQQEVEQLEAEGNKEEDKGAEIKDPSQLELKPLPSSLKYIFLEDNAKLVIISSYLNIREEKLLIEVLSKHKKAIGWTISDIKGISPTTYMHKILMEDSFKPTIQPQRRLNPTLQEVVKKEVVKKEVVKLLDADLVLARCEESNLVLNWEKCHFMVKEGIVLGHKISEKGIEVDRAKVEVIEKLPPPTNIKGIRSFLGHAGGWIPKDLSWQQRKKFLADVKYYFWEDPYLYKICPDQVIRRCVPETEVESILKHCHDGEAGGHFSSNRTAAKVLQSGFYWPTLYQDAKSYVSTCDRCQKTGKKRLLDLNELEELRSWASDNAKLYKLKTKK